MCRAPVAQLVERVTSMELQECGCNQSHHEVVGSSPAGGICAGRSCNRRSASSDSKSCCRRGHACSGDVILRTRNQRNITCLRTCSRCPKRWAAWAERNSSGGPANITGTPSRVALTRSTNLSIISSGSGCCMSTTCPLTLSTALVAFMMWR